MLIWRTLVGAGLAVLTLSASCQSQTSGSTDPAPKTQPPSLELPGIDTSKLTAREREQWSGYVAELLAPCPDQPVSIAQCVKEERACETCRPSAEFLVKQVTRGRTRSQAEDAFRLRFSGDEVKSVDIAGSPFKGPEDAPVTIVEWADFECPFCGIASPVLDDAVKRFPGRVKLVFKHYPLSSHEHAELAARAAVAAGMQGKFWEMHNAMFKNQQHLDEATLERLAAESGLDVKQFNVDRKGETAADKVTSDKKQADKLGLRGTPMIFLNGRSFDLETFDLYEDLDDWIQLEVRLRTGGKDTTVKNGSSGAAEGTEQAAASTGAAPAKTRADDSGKPVELQPVKND